MCSQLPQYLNPWLLGVLWISQCCPPPLPRAPPPTHTATSVDPKLPRSSSGVPQCLPGASVSPPYFLGCLIVSPNTSSPPLPQSGFLLFQCPPHTLLFGIPPQLPWGLTSEVLVSHLPPPASPPLQLSQCTTHRNCHNFPKVIFCVPNQAASVSLWLPQWTSACLPRSSATPRLPQCVQGCLRGPGLPRKWPGCLGAPPTQDLLETLAASMFHRLPQLCHPSYLNVPTLPL